MAINLSVLSYLSVGTAETSLLPHKIVFIVLFCKNFWFRDEINLYKIIEKINGVCYILGKNTSGLTIRCANGKYILTIKTKNIRL